MTSALPRVLLVEDSDAIRAAFTILLEESGYAVAGAPTGADALLLAAGSPPPDLVLLDLGLPDLPGAEVLRRLKADPATQSIPVVALTGRDDPAERDAALAAGCAAYLLKPVNTRALLEALQGYIGG
ncbi:MAG TPA: response regulator [Longimicrobium sp.]|nr:response regulator [Longimicrobium sp.]